MNIGIFKILNSLKTGLQSNRLSICYSNLQCSFLNDLFVQIIKEIGIGYSFDIVNFNITHGISAKINDVNSVRRNRVLIKISESLNHSLLRKIFEQSLIKIHIFDIKNNKNSLIIFTKNNLKKPYTVLDFASFCFKIIKNEILDDYIILEQKNYHQILEIFKNLQNYILVQISESLNRDFKKEKVQNLKIFHKIKEKVKKKVNPYSDIIFTFEILHKNLLSILFLIKNITKIINNKAECQKISAILSFFLLEQNLKFTLEEIKNETQNLKILSKIKEGLIYHDQLTLRLNNKMIDLLRYNKLFDKIKYDNFYKKHEITKNAIEFLIVPKIELQVKFLAKKIKEFIKNYNDKNFQFNNEEVCYNWRLFQMKFEDLEVYPAIFFWESYFRKFELIFQNENETILDFFNSQHFINALIDFFKIEDISIENIKSLNVKEF